MSTANQEYRPSLRQEAAFSIGERLIQACGFAVVVCVLAAGVVSPDPPSHGAADGAVLAFYQQHAPGILTGAFLWDLGMMALLLFAIVLGRACSALYLFARQSVLPQQAALLAADLVGPLSAVAAAVFIISQAAQAAAAVIALHGAPANIVRALDEISHMTGHLGTLPLGCLILAAGLAQTLARCGGSWIGWLGVATGSTLMATTSWVAFRQQWLHNAGVVALLAFLFWTAASSVSLLRLKRGPRAPAA